MPKATPESCVPMPDEGADVSLAETPQAEGLSRLRAEVDALVDEATTLEAELRNEQERLDRFQVDYVDRVAPLMAHVELLEAQLAGEHRRDHRRTDRPGRAGRKGGVRATAGASSAPDGRTWMEEAE